MNKLKRLIISSVAVLLFSGAALAVPAAAHGEDQLSGDTSTSSDSSDTTGTGHSGQLAEQFREMAKEKVQQAQANHTEQTDAQRQKVCEVRKNNLTKRMSRAVTVANQHKANIDRIYEKVKNFYTTKKLNVTNYDELTAKVDTAQTAATDSITALKNLDISVDCTSQTAADSVASFREAVSSTRDSLKAYRQALVDLITSLKGASTSTSNSTDNTTGQ